MWQEKQASIRLKKGKERALQQGHHWIYSGAIAKNRASEKDLFANIISHEGLNLGTAMLSPGRSIFGHMLAFGEESVESALSSRIASAIALRKNLFDLTETNAIRLINAEGDGLAGLIVDSYADVLVVQISHPALESIKSRLLEELAFQAKPRTIYEKSTSFLRKKEGLEEVRAHLYGEQLSEIEILENSLRFRVSFLEGQKTGLFLDQREMRKLVQEISFGRRVLNCFAYTGGFSVYALNGGATCVDSVEISKKCESSVLRNLERNGLSLQKHRFLAEDAIDFVAKKSLDYDLVILDPPAFAKQKSSIDRAFRAYKDLNRAAIQKMPSGSLLLTCSCSYHVGEELFQNILFRASLEAKRKVKILETHRRAHDHPVSIFHPESSYLKSLLLFVE